MRSGNLAVLAFVLASACGLTVAGEIYGKVLEEGKPVGEGAASVNVTCGGKSYPGKTDKTGSYRVVVAETGKCTMSVSYKGGSATLDIASYDEAAQIDLAVDVKGGKLSVRRK